ncbi:hypothetical protein [Roseibium sp.]|uniref:hypothetical protein n=1 Tax=Roseibium sp. TaxID=1936156 RepID=UPI003BAB950D
MYIVTLSILSFVGSILTCFGIYISIYLEYEGLISIPVGIQGVTAAAFLVCFVTSMMTALGIAEIISSETKDSKKLLLSLCLAISGYVLFVSINLAFGAIVKVDERIKFNQPDLDKVLELQENGPFR